MTTQDIFPSQGEKRDNLFSGWIILATVLIIGSILAGVRDSFSVFFKSLAAEFKLSRAETSSIYSLNALFSTIALFVKGWAIDRYEPRFVISLMGLLTGLGLLLTSQANALWQIYISYSVLMSLGTVGGITVFAPVISRWFHKNRGLALGVVSSSMGVGTIVVAPLAGYLILTYRWRMTYVLLGLLALFIVPTLALFVRKGPGDVDSLSNRLEPSARGNPSASQHLQENADTAGPSLKAAVRTRNFWLISSFWSLFALAWGMISAHIVPFATDRGISTIEAATILGMLNGFQIPARLLVGRAADRIGAKRPCVICALFGAGAMIVLIWSYKLWMFYVFAAFFGFSFGGISVIVLTLVGTTFGKRSLGVITAAIYCGFSLGVAFGSTFAGHMFDVTNSYTHVFIIGSIALFLIIPLAISIEEERVV